MRNLVPMLVDREFQLIWGQGAAALESINEDREEKYQSVVTGAPESQKNQSDLTEIKWRHVITMVFNSFTSK